MKPKHRNKALVGVAVWFVVLLVSVATLFYGRFNPNWAYSLGSPIKVTLGIAAFVLLLMLHFWSCHHLAKAKGYSTSVVFLGVLGPLAQLLVLTILLVLPDKAPEHTLRHRQKKPTRHANPEPPASSAAGKTP